MGFAIFLAACSLSGPRATLANPAISPAASSPSPQPGLLILLAPAGSDPQISSVVNEIASSFASAHDMKFQELESLSPADLPANLSTLIVLAPDPGAADLAAAAPRAQVIAIRFTPSTQLPNLEALLDTNDLRSEAAFLAGYVAVITTPDWRAGILYSPTSADLVPAFTMGARYFCGSCAPQSPPYNDYPQAAEASGRQDWQAAADELLAQSVKVVYLAPEMENSGAAEYLARSGVLLIGSGASPNGLEVAWLASIGSDPVAALRQQLPQALAGQPVQAASLLTITDPNPSYLSEGQLAFIQKTIDELQNGYIDLSEQP